MVFIKKRELVIYYILKKKFGIGKKINLGDIHSFLKPFISKKTLRNIIKRLAKYELITKVDKYEFILNSLDKYLNKLAIGFYCSKLNKVLKNYGGQVTCFENEVVIITKDQNTLHLFKDHADFLKDLGVDVKVRFLLPQKSQRQS